MVFFYLMILDATDFKVFEKLMPVIGMFIFKISFDSVFECYETFYWLKALYYNSKGHIKLTFSLLEGFEVLNNFEEYLLFLLVAEFWMNFFFFFSPPSGDKLR